MDESLTYADKRNLLIDMDSASIAYLKKIPHSLVMVLCLLFAVLWGVWLLPNTIFIRNFCLIIGGLIGLYVIGINRFLILKKEAAPIWLVLLLLFWVTAHLLFIGHDYLRQLSEYLRVWKRFAISIPFALGLGIAIMGQIDSPSNMRRYWGIVYFGFLTPTIIYFVKLLASVYLTRLGFSVPQYLILSSDFLNSKWGIPRASYVSFCLPSFAIALGAITRSIKCREFSVLKDLMYLIALPLTMLVFYIEGDRLGNVFAMTLVILSIVSLVPLLRSKSIKSGSILLIFIILLGTSTVFIKAAQKNPQWETLLADAKLALQVDRYDAWKYNRETHPGYPINEMGIQASDSNYMRIAWSVVGVRLLMENPLGYGLLSLSFGELSRENWPDAETNWSHSGWLDFALGYGLPGAFLLLFATMLSWRASIKTSFPWSFIGSWGLSAAALVMVAKENSSEAIVNALIFLVLFAAGLRLCESSPQKHGHISF